jgi:hypothetical protein
MSPGKIHVAPRSEFGFGLSREGPCAHMTNPYMASAVKRAHGFCPVYLGFLDFPWLDRESTRLGGLARVNSWSERVLSR